MKQAIDASFIALAGWQNPESHDGVEHGLVRKSYGVPRSLQPGLHAVNDRPNGAIWAITGWLQYGDH